MKFLLSPFHTISHPCGGANRGLCYIEWQHGTHGTFSLLWDTWWHHQMETFSMLLALCAGNSPVSGEFPSQRPVTWSFDVFFDLRLNKSLSKLSWGWWFETPLHPLWRHFFNLDTPNRIEVFHHKNSIYDSTAFINSLVPNTPHIRAKRLIELIMGESTMSYWLFSARQQYLQCVGNGGTAVLHYAMGMSSVKWNHYTGPLFTKKTPSYGYRNPHYKPKTVWRQSQVYNGNSYTDQTASS